ncbi:hypothetical protein DPMN_126359 [Dreissena polymorpha]|uniref:Uncharacterized protein n=1 Tax=Dreissena polymorpha TaxID=45954 RepID=A0A9D4H371_DREPO|nr:hypothetical protein DPMN_126359 [Dreissena polymorpha]
MALVQAQFGLITCDAMATRDISTNVNTTLGELTTVLIPKMWESRAFRHQKVCVW